jgi:hypothetical protein
MLFHLALALMALAVTSGDFSQSLDAAIAETRADRPSES